MTASSNRNPPIDSLSGREFENLIEQLLTRIGLRIYGRKTGADGGIDMVAHSDDPVIGGKIIIQCKRFSKVVDAAIIRDLFGVVHSEAANKGVLMTNSSFSREALRFAEGKPLELVDGAQLQKLLLRYGLLSGQRSTGGVEISPGVQLLYSQLHGPLKKLISESEKIRTGMIFTPARHVDFNQYGRIIKRHSGNIWGGVQTLKTLSASLSDLVNELEPSPEQLALLRSHIEEVMKIARVLVKDQKESQGLIPPEAFLTAHASYRRIVPELLHELWKCAVWAEDLIEGRLEAGKQRIEIDVDVPSFTSFSSEFTDACDRSVAQSKSACFIATATYGSPLDPRVVELRQFRDQFLVTSICGEFLGRFYYALSPTLARVVRRSAILRKICLLLLLPIVWIAELSNRRRSDRFERNRVTR